MFIPIFITQWLPTGSCALDPGFLRENGVRHVLLLSVRDCKRDRFLFTLYSLRFYYFSGGNQCLYGLTREKKMETYIVNSLLDDKYLSTSGYIGIVNYTTLCIYTSAIDEHLLFC